MYCLLQPVDSSIAQQRVLNQCIERTVHSQPEHVVRWFGGLQAQDYSAAKWALALRTRKTATNTQIDSLLNDGKILRTHVMRPTWHFVAPEDIYWMLELTAARVHQALGHTYRQFELDTAFRVRATNIFERALRDGQCLTRPQLGKELAREGITAKGVRLALVTIHAELEQVISSGPRQDKQFTYSLLPLRVSHPVRLSRDEAIAELALRYFRSHGPATLRDFSWWSGLTISDSKRSMDINKGRSAVINGLTYWSTGNTRAMRTQGKGVHLLPVYDEYLVAYRDLQAVPRKGASRGILPQALVVRGQIAGTWKNVPKNERSIVEVIAETRLTELERQNLAKAVTRYGRFLESNVECVLR